MQLNWISIGTASVASQLCCTCHSCRKKKTQKPLNSYRFTCERMDFEVFLRLLQKLVFRCHSVWNEHSIIPKNCKLGNDDLMADRPRFGPAGVPHMFRQMKAKLSDVPKLLRAEELDAFEYAAVRWGQVPQMKREDAETLGAEARKNDITLSLHGSYFINCLAKKKLRKPANGVNRVCHCCRVDGRICSCFSPRLLWRKRKTDALKKCVEALKEVTKTLESQGIKNVKLGPETMGRHSQFGTVDETLSICQEIERSNWLLIGHICMPEAEAD